MPSLYQPLIDAHTHIGSEDELSERQQKHILSLVCASTPSEADNLLKTARPYILPTAGLHPWQSEKFSVDNMLPYLRSCPVIGEIGMDSVWCDIKTGLQEKVFRAQLEIAVQMKKPVILHTKGEEDRIASIIANYPNTYLVHWYSCDKYPDSYISQNCYFSIGPDVLWNKAVRSLASQIPSSRILIETDGMDAVHWAYEEAPAPENNTLVSARENTKNVEDALMNTLLETAAIRNEAPDALAWQMRRNLIYGFLSSR